MYIYFFFALYLYFLFIIFILCTHNPVPPKKNGFTVIYARKFNFHCMIVFNSCVLEVGLVRLGLVRLGC